MGRTLLTHDAIAGPVGCGGKAKGAASRAKDAGPVAVPIARLLRHENNLDAGQLARAGVVGVALSGVAARDADHAAIALVGRKPLLKARAVGVHVVGVQRVSAAVAGL